MKKNIFGLMILLVIVGVVSINVHVTHAQLTTTTTAGSTSAAGTTSGGTTGLTTSTTGGTTTSTATTTATTGGTVGKITNPIKVNDFSAFVATVLGVILRIAIPIVAAFIIYSGLMFVLARGNSEKLEQAKTRLLYTLLGAGILLGAWMIATVIKATIEALTA